MTISIEEYLARFEEELEKKEGQLNLLEEKLNASRLLIKLHFGELLPENLKKYILTSDSAALPNENNSSQDSLSKKSSNDRKIILENHISCIEQVLQCKERINELEQDIQVLKKRKKTKKLLEKYNITDSNHFVKCFVEGDEIFFAYGFIGVFDDKLVIVSAYDPDLCPITIYFKNIDSISYNEKDIIDSKCVINLKSNEDIELTNINDEDSLIIINTFNKFMEKYDKNRQINEK